MEEKESTRLLGNAVCESVQRMTGRVRKKDSVWPVVTAYLVLAAITFAVLAVVGGGA